MDILYQETIGPALVYIAKYGDSWVVGLKDGEIERERTFTATAYDDDPYSRALDAYDNTCEAAAKIHNAQRPPMAPPDFMGTIQVK